MKTGAIGIRRAAPRDAAAITEVHDEAWRLAYRGILPGAELERMIARRGPDWWERAMKRRVAMLVLEMGETITGYATFGSSRARSLPYRGEIYELYLKPEYQGLGFGKQLFSAVRGELTRSGRRSVVAWALSDNDLACDFYARLGGKAVGRSVERIGEGAYDKVAYGFAAPPR